MREKQTVGERGAGNREVVLELKGLASHPHDIFIVLDTPEDDAVGCLGAGQLGAEFIGENAAVEKPAGIAEGHAQRLEERRRYSPPRRMPDDDHVVAPLESLKDEVSHEIGADDYVGHGGIHIAKVSKIQEEQGTADEEKFDCAGRSFEEL